MLYDVDKFLYMSLLVIDKDLLIEVTLITAERYQLHAFCWVDDITDIIEKKVQLFRKEKEV